MIALIVIICIIVLILLCFCYRIVSLIGREMERIIEELDEPVRIHKAEEDWWENWKKSWGKSWGKGK